MFIHGECPIAMVLIDHFPTNLEVADWLEIEFFDACSNGLQRCKTVVFFQWSISAVVVYCFNGFFNQFVD